MFQVLYNHFKCVITHPGKPPSNEEWETHASNPLNKKSKLGGQFGLGPRQSAKEMCDVVGADGDEVLVARPELQDDGAEDNMVDSGCTPGTVALKDSNGNPIVGLERLPPGLKSAKNGLATSATTKLKKNR